MDSTSLERWERLRGVEVARAILREAFGLALVLTGPEGPAAHGRGGIVRSSSDCCRASLFTRDGFSRCDAFYRDLSEGNHVCHLGLHAFAEPVALDGETVAHAVASGFLRDVETDRAPLLAALQALDPSASAETVRRVPVVHEGHPVRAVLRSVAAEIVSYERLRLQAARESPGMWGIVGRSPQMQSVFELLSRVVESDATTLILGESGTGKELVARALHERGRRRAGPFIAQNCAAVPDDLLDSALFGHVRGAFSGADRASEGLFGAADGGVLFLDEVGDMSPALQVKLLRVLQDGTYLPVGATTPRHSNVRVVAATHKDLAGLVRGGEFRQDLFYRLHVLSIQVPPLRDRVGDLPRLVAHFTSAAPMRISDAAWECLQRYRWPGNVRELRAEIQRWQLVAAEASEIVPDHLSPSIRDAGGYRVLEEPEAVAAAEGSGTLADAVEALERAIIERGLARTGGNRTQLARELGISRTTLSERLKRYGLD